MSIKYIIAQIIGLISFFITTNAYHRNKKKKILLSICAANILDIIHYFLISAYSGCITKVIAFIRNSFIILKDKYFIFSSKMFLYMFIIIYLVSCVFTCKNAISVLPTIAATIYLVNIWDGNELKIKKVAYYCYYLWLIYNIWVLSISGIISNIISIISTYIAYRNESLRSNKE